MVFRNSKDFSSILWLVIWINKASSFQYAGIVVQYEAPKMNTTLWIFKKSLDAKDNRIFKPIEVDLDGQLNKFKSNSNLF